MSKEVLKKNVTDASVEPYTWSLYFFKIDRRGRNPFIVHKVRFKNSNALKAYSKSLMEMVGKYQIDKLEKVQPYTGENSKVSCDRISLEDELIKENWTYMLSDIKDATDRKIEGKYNGYILTGIPKQQEKSAITLIKMANPIIEMKKQKSIAFNFTENDELDIISDDICRLYMDVDIIILQDCLYAFNLKVETLFNMQKTMQKIKERSIEQMISADALADQESFMDYAKSYTSPRTFLSLNQERMERFADSKLRKEMANLLELKTDKQGRIRLDNKEDASWLIRYLCFKVFKDYETKGLLEASNVTKAKR